LEIGDLLFGGLVFLECVNVISISSSFRDLVTWLICFYFILFLV